MNNSTRLVALLLGLFAVAGACVADEATVIRFSPTGLAVDVHQARARFDRAVVAFGDAAAPAPFEVDCPVPGQGQWVDGRNWIYDFDDPVPAAVRCRFTLREALTTVDGDPVPSAAFAFHTGGPGLAFQQPWQSHDAIDEAQVFLLGLDAPVDTGSVLAGAWCEIAGVAERVDVELLDAGTKRALLDDYPDFLEGYRRVLTDYGRQPIGMVVDGVPLGGSADERMQAILAAEPSPVLALRCKRHLPPDSDVALVLGESIRSPSGLRAGNTRRLSFHTRDAFRAEFGCRRSQPAAGCNPVLPMTLRFTAPVHRADAARITLSTRNGDTFGPDLEGETGDWIDSVGFPGPFRERTHYTLDLPRDLVDDAGRTLANAARFPLSVDTDPASALIKFPAPFGIVEFLEGAALPVTLRNIESVIPLAPGTQDVAAPAGDPSADRSRDRPWYRRWYQRFRDSVWPEPAEVNGRWLRLDDPASAARAIDEVRESQREQGRYDERLSRWVVTSRPGERSLFDGNDETTAFTLPKPGGRRAMEVIGIPFERPGFYLVEIASPRLGSALYGDERPYHAQTAVLVTDLAAHFKHGRESSLVWVTRLRSGQPLAGARVTIADCAGRLLFEGLSGADGIARVDGGLPPLPAHCGDYVVSVRKDGDMTFTLSGWNDGIENWRFDLPRAAWTTPNLASTVLDRALYRTGETVHMKHVLRRHDADGFRLPAQAALPRSVMLRHDGSGDTFEVDAWFDAAGLADSTWVVPDGARQGRYRIVVSVQDPDRGEVSLESGDFRVASFRVPTLEARVKAVLDDPVRPTRTSVDIQLNYLNGGGAGGLDVTVRSASGEHLVRFDGYQDYSLGNGAVVEGIEHDGMAEPVMPLPGAQTVRLDDEGGARVPVGTPAVVDRPVDLRLEVEYPDANGEILTRSARATAWPSAVVAGIRPDDWAASRDRLAFKAVVLDLDGRPLPGRAVRVDAFARKVYSHRKRLVGGFYAYESRRETVRAGTLCEGETDAFGRLACEVAAPASGNLVLEAVAVDDAGRASRAHRDVWVAGGDEWWFDVGNEDRMDVLAEQPEVEPGDTARLQVRMPFREAEALVTVEREGVLDAFVTTLRGNAAVVEVPIKDHYAPNVFVSVLAVRGRTDQSMPTALVDLDKPAFRLGFAELEVGRAAHRLDVTVVSDQRSYPVRSTATIDIEVTAPGGLPPARDAEVALAVVDEGLLALAPNESWDLLASMMGRRGLEVETATAQMQVVGKRHFGRKAVAAGGGGGVDATRRLFGTLLQWQGRVRLDARGRARVAVPLNDSLSAFRIVAVASAGAGLFGTGETTIRTARDIMLVPGLPRVVRRGDRFDAVLTVRNAAADGVAREVSVEARAGGVDLPGRRLVLPAGKSEQLAWRMSVPDGADAFDFEAEARVDGAVADRVAVGAGVIDAVPVRVQQGTMVRLDEPVDLPAAPPAGARPGRGGLRIGLSPSLIGDLPGVLDYLRRYPYTCLEQRVSRAVVLDDAASRAAVDGALVTYLDDDGLARYWPSMRRGDDILTSYVLAVTHAAGWGLPESARERMLDGLAAFLDGRLSRPSPMRAADLALRRLAAMDAYARYRPVDPAWLSTFEITPAAWPTSALVDWINLLGRDGGIADGARRLDVAREALRARLDFRGAVMDFSTASRDQLWWLMVSGDVNAARALLALLDDESMADDLPRLVRGLLLRRQGGRWDTTTANAWGMVAARTFADRFEAQPVSGVTGTTLSRGRDWNWTEAPDGGAIELPWPAAPATLRLRHDGGGAPWATIESLAAVPLAESVSRGYTVRRSVEPVVQAVPGQWRRGDVARVTLEIDAAADRTWVVVDDPVPSGASILGTGFGTDSALLNVASVDDLAPAHVERADDAFRAYYALMPRGRWRLGYSVRYNTRGRFVLPPTRVEAMYAPGMHGESPNDVLEVGR